MPAPPHLPPLEEIVQGLDASFGSTLLEIWLNGLYTFLFLLTMWGIYSRSRHGVGSKWKIATVTVVMYILSTVHMAMRWDFMRNCFIWNGSTRETVFKAISHPSVWWMAITTSFFSANTLIADCLFIWRCWIIWGRDWRVIVPSCILTIVGTVFSVLADIVQVLNVTEIASDLRSSPFFTKTSTIYLALSFATTLSVTVLIAYRILKVDGETRAALGNQINFVSRVRYSSVVEVIVESAAFYSVAELILLVLVLRGSSSFRYAQNFVAQVTGIAPTLIVTRITFGLARPSNNWSRSDALTPLVFASTDGGVGINDASSSISGSERDSRGRAASKYSSTDSLIEA